MTVNLKTFFGFGMACIVAALLSNKAQADNTHFGSFYKYGNNEAEYSVALPEAPTVETIWADDGEVPYLDSHPESGVIGEIANFMRVDPESDDVFSVKITFLKASKRFLASLTEDKMRETLEKDYSKLTLQNKKFDFSTHDGDLKQATLSGFTVDESNHPFYNVEYYLTGRQSIQVIRIKYSIENKKFQDYYNLLTKHITYMPM